MSHTGVGSDMKGFIGLLLEGVVCWVHLFESRECSPFKLLLLGLVAMLKAAMRASMRSGSKKMTKVVKESRCSGIDL